MLINRIDLPIRTLHIRAKKGRYKFQIYKEQILHHQLQCKKECEQLIPSEVQNLLILENPKLIRNLETRPLQV